MYFRYSLFYNNNMKKIVSEIADIIVYIYKFPFFDNTIMMK